MPTRKWFERNTKKNPWAMTNPNYKCRKSILSDNDLNVAAPFTIISTHSTSNVLSQMMILRLLSHFGPRPEHGQREKNCQTDLSKYLCNSVICTISSTWMLWI
jgi:hypothetical protein